MSAKAEWAKRLNCKDDETLEKVLREQEESCVLLTHSSDLLLSLHLVKKTTDQITAFNDFSAARYAQVQKHLEAHTRLLKEIKVDLDSAFRKIRYSESLLVMIYRRIMWFNIDYLYLSTLKKHCQEQHPTEHEEALE
ncbi:hypothetical protein INT43_004927, partial [Umbelopsis isabellina]